LLAGPRTFSLERLLTLFHGLLGSLEGEAATLPAAVSYGDLYAQVRGLEALSLLTRVSSPLELTHVRFVCTVGRATVFSVADTLQLDLRKFLHYA
jgi:hypothetical protein